MLKHDYEAIEKFNKVCNKIYFKKGITLESEGCLFGKTKAW